MHSLRRSLSLVRLVLAWFVLSLGVAVASPVVQPHTAMLICAEGGNKVIIVDANGEQVASAGHLLDCPMCLPAALPPVVAVFSLPVDAPSTCARHPFVSAHIAALTGAPLPARGPPRLA